MSGYDESLRVERTRDYVRLNKIQKKKMIIWWIKFQKQHYLDVVFSITPLSHSVFFDLIGVENNKSHICIFKSQFPVSINLLNLKLKRMFSFLMHIGICIVVICGYFSSNRWNISKWKYTCVILLPCILLESPNIFMKEKTM